MKHLPNTLEEDILIQLPIKSLVRFKSVCTRWHSLIEEPAFVTRYNNLAKCRRKLVCFTKNPITNTFVSISSTSSSSSSSSSSSQIDTTVEDLKLPPFIYNIRALEGGARFTGKDALDEVDFHILGPENGICCIYHQVVHRLGGRVTLILWNPATRSYNHLLPPITFSYPLFAIYGSDLVYNRRKVAVHVGFGYDDHINDYKVVVVIRHPYMMPTPDDRFWQVRVYNNATNTWTTITNLDFTSLPDDLPFPHMRLYPKFPNCFLKGSCHWSCEIDVRQEYFTTAILGVLAFDMVQHTFKVMRGPPISSDNHFKIKPSVWAVEASLVVLVDYNAFQNMNVEVWIMREYGVDDSWNLVSSIPKVRGFHVVGIPNGEQIILGDKKGELIAYPFHEGEVAVEDGVHIKPFDDNIATTIGLFNYEESLSPINHATRMYTNKQDQSNCSSS